jgi:hypothetical protein
LEPQQKGVKHPGVPLQARTVCALAGMATGNSR